MEVVLPTCIGPPNRLYSDLERARILAQSLKRYLAPGEPWTIHVIAADRELDQIRSGLVPFPLDFRFHRHTEVLPGFSAASGWVFQQFLKLEAVRLIEGEFYLTLDSDHILTRPLSQSDIVRAGRAMATPELRERHEAWWRGAAEILGTEPAYDPVIAMSCVCLSTALVHGLLKRLRERLGEDWKSCLTAQGDWTEYCAVLHLRPALCPNLTLPLSW